MTRGQAAGPYRAGLSLHVTAVGGSPAADRVPANTAWACVASAEPSPLTACSTSRASCGSEVATRGPPQKRVALRSLGVTTRRRNRTFQAGGCPALPVLKSIARCATGLETAWLFAALLVSTGQNCRVRDKVGDLICGGRMGLADWAGAFEQPHGQACSKERQWSAHAER
jgi:hypothetical protein